MRTLKEPEERRNEILDVSERLFFTKGYSQTTVQDILNEVGLAKGTFYYYFKSKDEVLDAIINRELDRRIERARQIIKDTGVATVDKLYLVLMDQHQADEQNPEMLEHFHRPSNAEMHQKSMIQVIKRLAPVLAEVVMEGIREGIVSTEYPLESTQILLASSSVLFDEGLFIWSDEEKVRMGKAFLQTMEQILGTKPGTFDNIMKIITG